MGVAKDFSKEVHKQLRKHAAWLPVTNTFQTGDFGVMSDGVFTRMGNIKSAFSIAFETQPGREARLDFKSEHVKIVRIVGGGEVSGFAPAGDVEASLKIEFKKERQFYVKALLKGDEMSSTFQVAQQLARAQGWDARKFKLVSGTYTGSDCLVLSSKTANTMFEVKGKASALQALEGGKAEAGLEYQSSSTLGLEVKGETGVLALDLVEVSHEGSVKILGKGAGEIKVVSLADRDPQQIEDDI